jgi:hypothetical protein
VVKNKEIFTPRRQERHFLFFAATVWYTGGMSNKKRLDKLTKAAGSLILDFSKLCFGSLVLGTVIRGEIPQSTLMWIGVVVSAGLAALGLTFITISEG